MSLLDTMAWQYRTFQLSPRRNEHHAADSFEKRRFRLEVTLADKSNIQKTMAQVNVHGLTELCYLPQQLAAVKLESLDQTTQLVVS